MQNLEFIYDFEILYILQSWDCNENKYDLNFKNIAHNIVKPPSLFIIYRYLHTVLKMSSSSVC